MLWVCFVPLLLGFSALVSLGVSVILLKLSSFTTESVHLLCVQACSLSDHRDLVEAIVCGESLISKSDRQIFERSGLIHLLVVSGSHLIVLDSLLSFFVPNSVRALLLLTYGAAANFQPPILRSLVFLFFNWVNEQSGLRLARWQLTTLSGFLVVPFCSTHWSLLSLCLSWCAALSLDLVAQRKRTLLAKIIEHTSLFSLIAIPLAFIAVPHPFVALTNLCFSSLFSLMLFPASLVTHLTQELSLVCESIWDLTLWIIGSAARLVPLPAHVSVNPKHVSYGFAWIFALTLLARWKAQRS